MSVRGPKAVVAILLAAAPSASSSAASASAPAVSIAPVAVSIAPAAVSIAPVAVSIAPVAVSIAPAATSASSPRVGGESVEETTSPVLFRHRRDKGGRGRAGRRVDPRRRFLRGHRGGHKSWWRAARAGRVGPIALGRERGPVPGRQRGRRDIRGLSGCRLRSRRGHRCAGRRELDAGGPRGGSLRAGRWQRGTLPGHERRRLFLGGVGFGLGFHGGGGGGLLLRDGLGRGLVRRDATRDRRRYGLLRLFRVVRLEPRSVDPSRPASGSPLPPDSDDARLPSHSSARAATLPPSTRSASPCTRSIPDWHGMRTPGAMATLVPGASEDASLMDVSSPYSTATTAASPSVRSRRSMRRPLEPGARFGVDISLASTTCRTFGPVTPAPASRAPPYAHRGRLGFPTARRSASSTAALAAFGSPRARSLAATIAASLNDQPSGSRSARSASYTHMHRRQLTLRKQAAQFAV